MNRTFIVRFLISKNYTFYFLEYNSATNNFNYPDIDTFKYLFIKYYSNDNNLYFNIIHNLKKIKDSYFKDKKELNFDYTGGTINYNFEESANKYEENMNQLRGSK